MDLFENRYYKINRFLLLLLGLWPYQNLNEKLIRALFVCVGLASSLFLQTCKLLTLGCTVDSIVRILQHVLISLCFIMTYFTSLVNLSHTKDCLERMKYDWRILKGTEEFVIVKKYARETRIYILIYLPFYATFGFSFLPSMLPLVRNDKFRNATGGFVDARVFFGCSVAPGRYFYVAFMHSIVSWGVIVTVAVTNYTLHLIFVQHICGMFRVAGFILKRAFDVEHYEIFPFEADANTYSQVVNGIGHFNRATEFVNLVNYASEISYLLQMLLAMIIVGVDFMWINLVKENISEIITCISHMAGTMFTIYINCYIGQKVLDQSGKVFDETCSVSYYVASVKTQKLLLLAMLRCLKPSALSIGKMYISTHEFFTKLLHMSLSYSMVFYSLQ